MRQRRVAWSFPLDISEEKRPKVISTTVPKDKASETKLMAGRYEELQRLRQQIRETDQKINELLNEYETHMEKEVTEYVRRKEKA